MNPKIRRRYTDEVKEETVRLVRDSARPLLEIYEGRVRCPTVATPGSEELGMNHILHKYYFISSMILVLMLDHICSP